MAEFFRPECGVPSQELRDAVAIEGLGRTTCACGYNCVLVETPAGMAIIDTGLGARFLGYGPRIEPLVGRLGDRLVTANAPVSELAAVVFTHLHQDHARGAIWSGNLTFPSALGFAHAAEIAFWSADSESQSDDPHRAEANEALRLFGTQMRSFDYETEILPGIHTVAAAGHTPGHTAILLESQGERLLCVGDSFYDPLQVSHPRWCTPWDNDPARAIVSRETVLARAADEQLLVHAYHMPFPGLGHVEREGDTYQWVPARRE